MNEELTRYLAGAVIKAGGSVRLTPAERCQAFDLTLKVAEDDSRDLIIEAAVVQPRDEDEG